MKQAYYTYWPHSKEQFNIYIGDSTDNDDNIIYIATGYYYDKTFKIKNIKTNKTVCTTKGSWFQWRYKYDLEIKQNTDISLITLINFGIDMVDGSIMSVNCTTCCG